MKTRVAIAGYGNLGKCLEKRIAVNDKFVLTHIFSRRNIDHPLRTAFTQAQNLNDIDVLLCTMGSYKDIEENISHFSRFDTVDCFDDHGKLVEYKRLLNATKPDTLSICAVGWDPGLMSVARNIFGTLGDVATTWGKGISMGHTNAIKSIRGVIDAVQFTVPQLNAETLFVEGEQDSKKLVKRICYVACVEQDKADVERQIRTMTDYFDGYETEVHFVSPRDVRALSANKSHRGTVYGKGDLWQGKFDLNVADNGLLTAEIMLKFAQAVSKLKTDGYTGACDIADIPLGYVFRRDLL